MLFMAASTRIRACILQQPCAWIRCLNPLLHQGPRYSTQPALREEPLPETYLDETGLLEKKTSFPVQLTEDEEIRALIRQKALETSLESPRLFASYTIGKPLVGELAPIRPREHRWEPMTSLVHPELAKQVKNQRPSTNYIAAHLREYDFTIRGFYLWSKKKHLKLLRQDQTYDPERVRALGPELAAAHFLAYRGAKIKFHGVDRWYSMAERNEGSMPKRFVESARVEAIDASGTELLYEGLDNLVGLRYITSLKLANCKYIDDWCLPKLFIMQKTLQHLDLSGCAKVSDRGLSSLYHLRNLRSLTLENLPGVENKEMIALLLEDELPLCEMHGVEYNKPLLPPPAEQRRLQESEWDKMRIPLWHSVARPECVEVGNSIYPEVLLKEKVKRQKERTEPMTFKY